MAEKKWWEKVNNFFQPISSAINETKKQTTSPVTTPTNIVNSINNALQPGREANNIVKQTTQGQAAGNAKNYSNLASGNHSWNTGNKTTEFGLAPLYTSADRYSPEKIAASKQNTGSSGGGGTVSGYYSGGGGYSAYPGYVSPYADQLEDVLDKLMNRGEFSYDYLNDPLYQQYAKSYGIQGDLARQDTLGDVSSMTGGLPSSYAVTAAQQAQNSWNSALNDMIPALQDAAYQRWMGDYEADANLANMLTTLDSMAYDRYNTDRNYNLALQEANNRARRSYVTNNSGIGLGEALQGITSSGMTGTDWVRQNGRNLDDNAAENLLKYIMEELNGGNGLSL